MWETPTFYHSKILYNLIFNMIINMHFIYIRHDLSQIQFKNFFLVKRWLKTSCYPHDFYLSTL